MKLAHHDWHKAEFVDAWLFHPIEEPDPLLLPREEVVEDLEYDDEADLSEQRVGALLRGVALSAREIRLWRRLRACRAFDEEMAYYDGGRYCAILKFKGRSRQYAHMGVLDWTGLDGEWVAGYRTAAEVVNAFRDIVYLSLDDYVARSPNAQK